LRYLRIEANQFTGNIPESICNLNELEWEYTYQVSFNVNQFCPPYPECIPEVNLGYQDTSECIEYQIGDVNQDTEINIVDIVLIVEFIMEEQSTVQQFILSDWNEDGEVNVVDIVQMVYYILNN